MAQVLTWARAASRDFGDLCERTGSRETENYCIKCVDSIGEEGREGEKELTPKSSIMEVPQRTNGDKIDASLQNKWSDNSNQVQGKNLGISTI